MSSLLTLLTEKTQSEITGKEEIYLNDNGSDKKVLAASLLHEVDVASKATGGTGTANDPWTGWDTAITWTAFTTYKFKAGYFKCLKSPNYMRSGIRLIGDAGSVILVDPALGTVSDGVVMDAGGSAVCSFTNGSANITLTIDEGSPTYDPHGFRVGTRVRLYTSGSLPTGFATGTDYYVVSVTNNGGTIQISATEGGSAISAASAGSGAHNVYAFEWNSNVQVKGITVLGAVKQSGVDINGYVSSVDLHTVTINTSTDVITSSDNHGYSAGDKVFFYSLWYSSHLSDQKFGYPQINNEAGASFLQPNIPYYVLSSGLTATEFKISRTPGGTAVNFTTAGTQNVLKVTNGKITGVNTQFTTQCPAGSSLIFGRGQNTVRSYLVTHVASDTVCYVEQSIFYGESGSFDVIRLRNAFFLRGVRDSIFDHIAAWRFSKAGVWSEACVVNEMRTPQFNNFFLSDHARSDYQTSPQYGIVLTNPPLQRADDWTTCWTITAATIEASFMQVGLWLMPGTYGNTIVNGTSENQNLCCVGARIDGLYNSIINFDIEQMGGGGPEMIVAGSFNTFQSCNFGASSCVIVDQDYDRRGTAAAYNSLSAAQNVFINNTFANFYVRGFKNKIQAVAEGDTVFTRWTIERKNGSTHTFNSVTPYGNADGSAGGVRRSYLPIPDRESFRTADTLSIDCNAYTTVYKNVGADITIPNPTNPLPGDVIDFILNGDTVPRSITWGSDFSQAGYGHSPRRPTFVPANQTLYVQARYHEYSFWEIINVHNYTDVPQNPNSASTYTIARSDSGKHIYNTYSGAAFTIPTNASAAFPIGALITLVNESGGTMTIAAPSGGTLNLANSGSVASATLANYGVASLLKVGTDKWFISGNGLS